MRIAIIADPYIRVSPEKCGGIERVMDQLIAGYLALGHQVTLFAHPAPRVKRELVPCGISLLQGPITRAREALQDYQRHLSARNML
jgi:hypothetical protein